MKNGWRLWAFTWIACGVLAVPVLAHHGTEISYDRSKPITLTGTVTEFKYTNPHPIIFFDIVDKDGKVVHWVGEVPPTPFTLAQNGWGKKRAMDALMAGKVINITVGPSRAGAPAGVVIKVVDDKGEPILAGLGNGRGE
jgi:hypothetical protein